MGTNFYAGHFNRIHIGKRSAAGLFCWDCRMTLAIGGFENIHTGMGFHDRCPSCGKLPDGTQKDYIINDSSDNSILKPRMRTGVRQCSSFTWAIKPEHVKKYKIIRDEYGNRYSLGEFVDLLRECPINTYAIGVDFC